MGAIRTSANDTFRDFVTDGVPASGANEPLKSAVRSTFGEVEDAIDTATNLASSAAVGLKWTSQAIRVRSTANVVIASALENGDTLNGVTLATGDHVFLGSQTAPAENGIYTVVASGAASRATFADAAAELAYIAFVIREGTVGAGERWTLPLASSAITVGTTSLVFAQIGIEVDLAAEVAALEATVNDLEPLLGVQGVKLVEASGASVSPSAYIYTTWTAAAFTVTAIAAAGERRRLNLFSNAGAVFDVTFDLAKGVVEPGGTGTGAITPLGNDSYSCVVTGTATAGASNVQFRVYAGSGGNPHVGDGVAGLYVKQATIAQGATVHHNTTDFSGFTLANITVTPNARQFSDAETDLAAVADAVRKNRPLQGRKAAFLGTSLVAQNQYVPVITSDTGLVIQNLGVSGGSLGTASNGHYGSELVSNEIANIATDVDMVVIDAMTNDFAAAVVPIGTIADTTKASFYGAIYAACVAIAARVPGVPIVWIQGVSGDSRAAGNSITATNANGAKLYQFQRALAEQCQRLGCALIDINQANVGYFASTSIRSDGLHWNAAGGAVVGGYIGMELEQLARAGAL